MDDIEQIRRVIALYAQLIDHGRYDEWAELFTPEVQFVSISVANARHVGERAPSFEPREAMVERIEKAMLPFLERGSLLHLGGHPVIDVSGDTARAWWDFIVVEATTEETSVTQSGRFHTTLVREGPNWRIESRVTVHSGQAVPEWLPQAPGR